ncbi:MAG: hypothetical protein HY718_17360, partial [Planctomycetes bacterium]|nr:hypothetical protein [Planctomycetota bacterium]
VQAAADGEATVEISYFTSGLSWSADYVAIADPPEAKVDITGFVRVFNQSGEEYENAQVRLVVGTINLVEVVAELARRRYGVAVDKLSDERASELKRQVNAWFFGYMDMDVNARGFAEGAPVTLYAADLAMLGRPKEVAKDSLGEYFIYTIEGTETIPNGWSKRLRSFEGHKVPMRAQYRYRPAEYGDKLVRLFILTNNEESKLGKTPLPDGVARVYRGNGREGLAFLASQPLKYVPIGDKIELNLGPDPRVIHEWVRLRGWRDNFWFHRAGLNVYRHLDGRTRLEVDDQIAGWEDHARCAERIRNYSGRPIDVEIRRSFPGHAVFISRLPATQHDYNTVELTATCPPGRATELTYHLQTLEGTLAKQQNVTLQTGD